MAVKTTKNNGTKTARPTQAPRARAVENESKRPLSERDMDVIGRMVPQDQIPGEDAGGIFSWLDEYRDQ